MPQTVERGVDVDGSGADLFEKPAQLILIHTAKCNGVASGRWSVASFGGQ